MPEPVNRCSFCTMVRHTPPAPFIWVPPEQDSERLDRQDQKHGWPLRSVRPGWDCHGLPIETQVEKELGGKARIRAAEFRTLPTISFSYLRFDGQSVAIPAGDVRSVVASHAFGLDDQVFQNLVQAGTQMMVPVGMADHRAERTAVYRLGHRESADKDWLPAMIPTVSARSAGGWPSSENQFWAD